MDEQKDKTQFSTGAMRDGTKGKPRMDLLPLDLLMRVADWYGQGATKYGDNNWRKGQKVSHCVGSILRHLTKWVMGERDEDHLSAIIFNTFSIMNVEMNLPDNADIYDMGKPVSDDIDPKTKRQFDEVGIIYLIGELKKWLANGYKFVHKSGQGFSTHNGMLNYPKDCKQTDFSLNFQRYVTPHLVPEQEMVSIKSVIVILQATLGGVIDD